MQQQSYSAASSQQSWQQSAGGFNARQVAGYGASRQSGASAIQQSGATLIQQNGASSAYQSTNQSSYRGQQLEARAASTGRSSTGRKTWAESSILHGQGAAMGQSLYAQVATPGEDPVVTWW